MQNGNLVKKNMFGGWLFAQKCYGIPMMQWGRFVQKKLSLFFSKFVMPNIERNLICNFKTENIYLCYFSLVSRQKKDM